MENLRIQYRVCDECKDIIFTPVSEQIIKFDWKRVKFIEVCCKCKDIKKHTWRT